MAVLGVLGVAISGPSLRPAAWTWVHGAALLAAGLTGLALGTPTGLALLVTWLLVHRAWTVRTADDVRISLLLSTLLLLLGAVASDSILLAPAMVAYGALLPVALLRAELADTRVSPVFPAAIALICGMLAAAFFVALPRLDGGYLGHREGGHRFPEDVSLGGDGLVNDDGAEVLRLHATTRDGVALPGPFHLRGRALDRFDGRRWTAGTDIDRTLGDRWDVRAEVRTSGASEVLFGVPDIVRVDGIAARLDPGSAWVPRAPARSLHYFAVSRRVALGEVQLAGTDRWLQLPESLDRRIFPLAWSVLPDEEDPAVVARALTDWLQGHYTYVETPGEPVGDPLGWFLFDSKAGHCEYFASALTVLLRARGIPARLATGFYSEEVDSEGWIVVREGNAHAWVEIPTADGWATLDPTPATSLPTVDAGGLRARLDDLVARWYLDVVEYDMDAQFAAYGAIGKRFLFATGASVPEGSLRAGLLGMVLVVTGLGLTLGAGRVAINRLGGPRRRALDPLARLAKDARQTLRRRGWNLPPDLPLEEAAAWLRARVGDEAAPLERFATLVYRSRYGGAEVPVAELRACVRALGHVRRLTTRPTRG